MLEICESVFDLISLQRIEGVYKKHIFHLTQEEKEKIKFGWSSAALYFTEEQHKFLSSVGGEKLLIKQPCQKNPNPIILRLNTG